jgi:electron transport complex protein RnfA
VEIVIQKTSPVLYQALGIYLPLITTNCAVLGVAILNIQRDFTFVETAIFGFGASVGFTLALVLFSGLRERIALADVPRVFQGTAIALITAGLLSLAFMGFTGLVK